MIQRGLIILIVGEALFIIGVILAIVWVSNWLTQSRMPFDEIKAYYYNQVSIEPGNSVDEQDSSNRYLKTNNCSNSYSKTRRKRRSR